MFLEPFFGNSFLEFLAGKGHKRHPTHVCKLSLKVEVLFGAFGVDNIFVHKSLENRENFTYKAAPAYYVPFEVNFSFVICTAPDEECSKLVWSFGRVRV